MITVVSNIIKRLLHGDIGARPAIKVKNDEYQFIRANQPMRRAIAGMMQQADGLLLPGGLYRHELMDFIERTKRHPEG